AYFSLKKEAAPGVDGETWRHYGEELERNLQNLSERLKRGAYRAKPVRRVYIAKTDGRQRPLGVPVLEDKIVQRATVEVLNAIYETDFLGFSYGFRPGRSPHQALDALAFAIGRRKVSWILDADIRGYFEHIDRSWMTRFLEHRIGDRRVLRLIQKWMSAGVIGRWGAGRCQERGQGARETFAVLGCAEGGGRGGRGRWGGGRGTEKRGRRGKLTAIREERGGRGHLPIPEQGGWLERVVRGHY